MRFVGYNEPAAALFAEIVAGRRLPEVDALLGRRPADTTPEPLVRCRAECGRDLPRDRFSPSSRAGRLYPYCRECAAARAAAKYRACPALRERQREYNRQRRRAARGKPRTEKQKAYAREAIQARAVRCAKENPAFGVCVVCGGPVAKRLRAQRKTCERRECLSEVRRVVAKALRAGRKVASYEEAIRTGGAA